jgi:hypothetical protein
VELLHRAGAVLHDVVEEDWWQANESQIQLYDPWLELLEQQKID